MNNFDWENWYAFPYIEGGSDGDIVLTYLLYVYFRMIWKHISKFSPTARYYEIVLFVGHMTRTFKCNVICIYPLITDDGPMVRGHDIA